MTQQTNTGRKVVLFQLLSLDGVAEEPGDWFSDGGPEHLENIGTVVATQDDVLLGRGTYDYWAPYWPTSDVQPFADFINGVRKHVITSTPLGPAWQNATAVTQRPADHVAWLKTQPGQDIGIHGSIGLAQSLLVAGLVDELRLTVAPVVAGSGRKLFSGEAGLRPLSLMQVDRSPQGTLFLTYTIEAIR